jgi:hypothetical protein
LKSFKELGTYCSGTGPALDLVVTNKRDNMRLKSLSFFYAIGLAFLTGHSEIRAALPSGQVRAPFCRFALEGLGSLGGLGTLDSSNQANKELIEEVVDQRVSLVLSPVRTLHFGLRFTDESGVWRNAEPQKVLTILESSFLPGSEKPSYSYFPSFPLVNLTGPVTELLNPRTHRVSSFLLGESLLFQSEELSTGKTSYLELHKQGMVILSPPTSLSRRGTQDLGTSGERYATHNWEIKGQATSIGAKGPHKIALAHLVKSVATSAQGKSKTVHTVDLRILTLAKAPAGRGNLSIATSQTQLAFITSRSKSKIFIIPDHGSDSGEVYGLYLDDTNQFVLRRLRNLGTPNRIFDLEHAEALEDKFTKSEISDSAAPSLPESERVKLYQTVIPNFIPREEKLVSIRAIKNGLSGQMTIEVRTDKHFYTFKPLDFLVSRVAGTKTILPQPLESSGTRIVPSSGDQLWEEQIF